MRRSRWVLEIRMPKLEYMVKGIRMRSTLAAGLLHLPITPVVLRV